MFWFRGVVVAKGVTLQCFATTLGNHHTRLRLRHHLTQRIGSYHTVRLFVLCLPNPSTMKRARSVSSYLSLFGLREELTAILAGFPGIIIDGYKQPCDRLTVFAYWLIHPGNRVQAPEAFQMKLSFLCT